MSKNSTESVRHVEHFLRQSKIISTCRRSFRHVERCFPILGEITRKHQLFDVSKPNLFDMSKKISTCRKKGRKLFDRSTFSFDMSNYFSTFRHVERINNDHYGSSLTKKRLPINRLFENRKTGVLQLFFDTPGVKFDTRSEIFHRSSYVASTRDASDHAKADA